MSEIAPAAGGQGAAAPASSPAAAPAAAPAPAIAWLPNADEVTVGYVTNKGWDDPSKAIESYKNLEKLMGADRAGNTVILPKPDASPEDIAAFYTKLGRPSEPAGYKLAVPEGGDPAFASAAAAKFHELGIPQKAGQALAEWWNGKAGEMSTAQTAAAQAAFDADDASLKTAWGAAFQQNVTQAQAAARGLGVSNEMVDKLQASMGHKATMEFFQKIGAKMGEADFVAGDKTEKFGSALTPGQAKAKIGELIQDKDFVKRYHAGGAAEKAEMARLHQFAHPES